MYCAKKKIVVVFGDDSFLHEIFRAVEPHLGELLGKISIPIDYSKTNMPSIVHVALMQLASEQEVAFVRREFSHDGTHVLLLDAVANETMTRALVECAPSRIHIFDNCVAMAAQFKKIVLDQNFCR